MSNSTRLPVPRAVATLLLALALPILAGCGAGKGDVSGKVTYAGKPLPYGSIQFQAASGSVHVSQIDSQGAYSISDVPAGTAKMSVSCVDPAAVEFAKAMSAAGRDHSKGKVRPKGSLEDFNKIPTKYGDFTTSGLTYDVKPGSQTYDVELK